MSDPDPDLDPGKTFRIRNPGYYPFIKKDNKFYNTK